MARSRDTQLAEQLSGAQTGLRGGRAGSVIFKPMTLLALLAIGVFSFAALIVLSGFADDLRRDPPGQATPRSVSAVGYKAVLELLSDLDFDIRETRDDRKAWESSTRLILYTPENHTAPLEDVLDRTSSAEARLIVLPKWRVDPMVPQPGETARKGWVRRSEIDGLYTPPFTALMEGLPPVERKADVTRKGSVVFESYIDDSPVQGDALTLDRLQYFDLVPGHVEDSEADDVEMEDVDFDVIPILSIDKFPVLIRLNGTNTFVLSEPDLLNTLGLQTRTGSRVAVNLVNEVISLSGAREARLDVDLSVHGLQAGRNVIKLMLSPPFLAATLCLLAAGALVAWQGFNRFGDPERQRPDYAQGPVSLARTAADFMNVANRAHRTGPQYAELVRRRVLQNLGYRASTRDRLDQLLAGRERLREITPDYATLIQDINTVAPEDFTARAKALDAWHDAMTTEIHTTSDLQKDTT